MDFPVQVFEELAQVGQRLVEIAVNSWGCRFDGGSPP